jgi:hypothetical protein
MRMTRGLFRVWVVAAVVWLAGWITYVWETCLHEHRPGSPSGELGTYCYTNVFSDWMSPYSFFTVWDYARIIISGASIPLVVLLFGAAVGWAARGFRAPG